MSSFNEDSSLVTHSSQGKIDDKVANVNYDRAVLINRLLAFVVSIVESDAMKILQCRIAQLVSGGWLPGKVDMTTIGALTNKSEETIKDVVAGRSRYKVGGTAYYPIGDIAIPYDLPVNVAPAKRKTSTASKTPDKNKGNRKAP